ncbi:MAG: AAA family ATPase [Thermoplasmata archaeon]|nr:AAA family ATPase [Thermoplasmata archaeon]
MFVNQLDIKEFRGIKKCSEPIPLTGFTVLIGRNNSGKSAILEALSFLPHPMSRVHFRDRDKIGFVKDLHSGKPLVYGYSGTAEITFKMSAIKLDEEEWHIKLSSYGKTEGIEFYYQKDSTVDASNWATLLGIEKNKLENMVVFLPNDTEIIKELDTKLMRMKDQIMKLGAHVSVAKHINECVDDDFTEILLESHQLSLRKELPDGNVFYIQLNDLGDGIKKAIKIMLLLEVIKPDLVLIDDFEASAHPGLIGMLLKWLSKKKWQVVLSTHSIDVLYQLLEVRPEDLSILQFRKTEDDIQIHETLTLDDLEALIDANQDPRLLVDALGVG